MKTLLVVLLGLEATTSFAQPFTALRCQERFVSSNVVMFHVRNKYLKRIGKDEKAENAPVIFFDHYSRDNKFMVYVTDLKNGHEVALPVQDWDKGIFEANTEFEAGERTVTNHLPQKGHTNLKCQVFPNTHLEF